VATKTAGTSANLSQTTTYKAGTVIRVEYTVMSIDTAGVFVRLGGSVIVDGATRTTAGTFTEQLTAPAGMTDISIRSQSTTNVVIDNISVREVGL
jgi:hypothetical protein